MSDIIISIPVELTCATILRGGVVEDSSRALELAEQLHEVVAACAERYIAERKPDALELADFLLAVWRQSLVWAQQRDTPDGEEAMWISELLESLFHDDDANEVYLRWLQVGDLVTGSDVATMLREGRAN
jgi:hypothetical protein